MTVTTLNCEEIDVSEWLDQMRENIQLGKHVLEQTPISKNADGDYVWRDKEKNPILTKKSVNQLIKSIQ